jgi:hypothetical protein
MTTGDHGMADQEDLMFAVMIHKVCTLATVLQLFIGTSYMCSKKKIPCGGGIEYLHHDPASRKKRQNGKSQI